MNYLSVIYSLHFSLFFVSGNPVIQMLDSLDWSYNSSIFSLIIYLFAFFICSAFLGVSSFCLLALELSFSNVNMFLISKSSFMLCFYFIASYFLFSRCNLLSFLEPLNVLNILSLFYIAFADYTLYLLIFFNLFFN